MLFSLCQEYCYVKWAKILQLLFSLFRVGTMKQCETGLWGWGRTWKGEVH